MKSVFFLAVAIALQPLGALAAPLSLDVPVITKIPAQLEDRDTGSSASAASADAAAYGTPICTSSINSMCTTMGAYCDASGYHNKNWNPSCVAAPGVCWCD